MCEICGKVEREIEREICEKGLSRGVRGVRDEQGRKRDV